MNRTEDKVSTVKSGYFSKPFKVCDMYMPKQTSAEADICLNCPLKDCNPNTCKRYRKESEKLKEHKNGTN